MRIVVQDGTVIDPANGLEANLDLLIEEGVIRELGQPGGFASSRRSVLTPPAALSLLD